MELDFLNIKDDINIVDSFAKADSVINNPRYKSIMCSVSGGSDSDIMIDLIYRIDKDKKVKYVWIDTGLEYKATKKHLDYLNEKYNIEIIRERAIKPIPICCKEYGQPFLSKHVSEMIDRLQRHNFKWENKTLDELIKIYPNCKSALLWWTNSKGQKKLNINYNRYLKDFIITNPPTFKISSKCCDYAKKNVSKQLVKKNDVDLMVTGVRKSEGGIRSTAYKNCYSINDKEIDTYRPIFWYKDNTKKNYENKFNVVNSDCYKKYGFKRTGCCCCPYGRAFEKELEVTRIFEPKLYTAVCKIFKESYEYTRMYKEFVWNMKMKRKDTSGQRTIFDYMKNP